MPSKVHKSLRKGFLRPALFSPNLGLVGRVVRVINCIRLAEINLDLGVAEHALIKKTIVRE